MFAKRGTTVISLLAVLAMLFAFPLTAFAANSATVHDGGGGTFVTCVNYLFTTLDNGMNGKWATDYFDSTVCIYQLEEEVYRFVFVDGGYFITRAAKSPGGDGSTTVAAGIRGTISGGTTLILEGELEDNLPSVIGPIDFTHRTHPKYEYPFFDDGEYEVLDQPDWGWVYSTCGNGTWVDNADTEDLYNAIGPNATMGDVKGQPASCKKPAKMLFDGLYAYINPGYKAPDGYKGVVGPRDVCFVISTQGRPSVERLTAVCDNAWPVGPRPGWSKGAALLVKGAVFDDGTVWGFWEGDAAVKAFSPNVTRLPLNHVDGYWSYLYKEFCHYEARIGTPQGYCR